MPVLFTKYTIKWNRWYSYLGYTWQRLRRICHLLYESPLTYTVIGLFVINLFAIYFFFTTVHIICLTQAAAVPGCSQLATGLCMPRCSSGYSVWADWVYLLLLQLRAGSNGKGGRWSICLYTLMTVLDMEWIKAIFYSVVNFVEVLLRCSVVVLDRWQS